MRQKIGILAVAFIASTSCQRLQRDMTSAVPASQTSTVPPNSPTSEAETIATEEISPEWVKTHLEAAHVSFVSIVDRKPWLQAPVPSATAILGIARQPAQGPLKELLQYSYFPYVLLAQTQSGKDSSLPKLLGLAVSPDFYVVEPFTGLEEQRPLWLDVDRYQIRADEYAFGARLLTGSLGNKGGPLAEVLSLYRYHDGVLKEIFRDVVWSYSKYSDEGWRSCNVDMQIVSSPSATDGFFRLTREYRRSYFGDSTARSMVSNTYREDLNEVPACSLSTPLKTLNTHLWNTEKGLYLDARGRLLQPDDFFTGWPYR